MNLEQLKKNVGQRVRLRPIARRFDENGRELEQIDDVWTMLSLTDGIGVTLQNPRSGHQPVLGKDHIYSYASDGERDGIKHGFLTLHVQLFLRAFLAEKEPTPRPGEPALTVPLLMRAPLNSAWSLEEQTRFAAARETYARSPEGIHDADEAFEQILAELTAAADKLRGADPAVAVRRQQTYFTIAARTY
ncbi:MAG TPA: hypothetical protein VKS43_15175, partial [Burkholderiales bacterium]|nr:hypothetical protein [Burkholderiales bacterium]